MSTVPNVSLSYQKKDGSAQPSSDMTPTFSKKKKIKQKKNVFPKKKKGKKREGGAIPKEGVRLSFFWYDTDSGH